jgi:hypothetical protein
MTGEQLANLTGTAAALAIALTGWVLHVRECRANMRALRDENAKLIDTLAHLADRQQNHAADQWRRAP